MIEELSKKLNYTFNDSQILLTALTHRSKGGDHNERLEFLGDAVVNFVVAELLYQQYPKATEGELSRLRAVLVNRDALAELSRQFDLGRYLFLGPGEQRSGGHERHSILSCTMEAVIGAIYLDGGFSVIKDCLTVWYADMLKSLSSAASHKDAKTKLQEFLQAARSGLPIYKVETIAGEAHQQSFTVSCQVDGIKEKTLGQGTSRRRAEQEAAEAMLTFLKNRMKGNRDE